MIRGPKAVPWVALGTACALASCSALPPATGGHPATSPSPSAALVRADAEAQSGRWSEAEAGYRALVARGDAHAESHLAVLLAYESRFVEAVAAAQDAVTRQADADTLARLARALDWAGDLPPAVAAGERAIGLAPHDALAHAFLAEALSDSGLANQAQLELHAAEKLATTAYERAEAAREWSNYERDQGADAVALSYDQIALHLEPSFPGRAVELARADLASTPPRKTEALALLDGLLQPFAREPAVLSAAGDVMFMAGDGADSERYYGAALAGAAADPQAALGLAEDQMAFGHDAHAARATLLPAVGGAGAEAGAAAEYLRQLDQLVLGIDPKPDLSGAASTQLPTERAAALAAVNAYRHQVALPGVTPNHALDSASQAHAYYVLFHWGSAALEGLGVHQEVASQAGYTGSNSAVRDQHFGYSGYQSSEVINHAFTAAAAVEVWADSVYHRFPITGRESADAGYGEAQVGTLAVQVMDFGVGPPGTGAPIAYPPPGLASVPPAFVGNEIPDPAPDGQYPIGYPITVAAGAADALAIDSATIAGPDGAPVPLFLDRPGLLDLAQNEVALLPKAPLALLTTYTVTLRGFLDDRPWSLSWKFTTSG